MIFEVVAALKLANDAISTIKTSMNHVHSIKDLAKPLTQLADAKETLEKKSAKGDLEAFVELKQIQDQENRLKHMMIWEINRPDLWNEYQTFLETRKKLRENELKRIEMAKKKRREDIKNGIIVLAGAIAVISLIGAFIMMLQWFAKGDV